MTYVNTLFIFIAISVIVALLVLLWWLPKHQMRRLLSQPSSKKEEEKFHREKERLKLEDDSRKTLAQILGGLIILFGLIFTYNTFVLNREGQITERFFKAVSLLGNEKEEVRIGSLYALKRIATDSEEDSQDINNIFEEYIRKNLSGTGRQCKTEAEKKDLPVDVSVALETLATNSKKGFDFKNANFSCMKVPKLNLINSKFYSADFRNSEFFDVNLNNSVIRESSFDGASLYKATLMNATVENSSFNSAILTESELYDVGFAKPDFSNANFEKTDFKNSVFSEPNFANTNFKNTNLYFCRFIGKITFSNDTDSAGRKIRPATVEPVNLSDTDLTGANLGYTDFTSVNLSKTKGLTYDQLREAIIDGTTILPPFLESRKIDLINSSIDNIGKLNRSGEVSEVKTMEEIIKNINPVYYKLIINKKVS